jgi:biofilm PGA synthesis N-glycosyltransferase PgaC
MPGQADPALTAVQPHAVCPRGTDALGTPANAPQYRRYVAVRTKFAVALAVSLAWMVLSMWLATPWVRELSELTMDVRGVRGGRHRDRAGFMNAFILSSLLMDRRPRRVALAAFPPLTILVAAYNEADSIADTLVSIDRQRYPGELQVIVIDDGSTDATAGLVDQLRYPWLTLLRQPRNAASPRRSTAGSPKRATPSWSPSTPTRYLYANALTRLVERYASDPVRTRAVAGAMLVRNSRTNWVTRMQEWGLLPRHLRDQARAVALPGHARGPGRVLDLRSPYAARPGRLGRLRGRGHRAHLGDPRAGWRVGHAEDAICFTNAPTKVGQLVRQRQRWARGMIEAFRRHPRILLRRTCRPRSSGGTCCFRGSTWRSPCASFPAWCSRCSASTRWRGR